MPRIPSNDTGLNHAREARATPIVEPDAHGQAALLLTESLLHTLVEKGALSAVEAMGTVCTAAEVKREVAALIGESNERMQASLDLLDKIESSFATYGR
ncbi:MAG: hypothetical protein H7X93_07690 [Sphingomonadaceae bacterium]|nr:hypothetical protein [Sphingomonadaceae bacterium]